MNKSASTQMIGLPRIGGVNKKLKGRQELVNAKQTTAFHLLQREEMNAKRSRMESLLTQQFIGKYGSRQKGSKINVFIKATVVDFLHSFTNMAKAEAMIGKLEKEVSERTSKMKSEVTSRKAEYVANQRENNRGYGLQGSNQERHEGDKMEGFSFEGNVEPSWAVLNALKIAEAEEKERREQAQLIEARLTYKKELDAQRDALRNRNNNENSDKIQEHEKNVRAAKEFEQEKMAKQKAKAEHHARERILRLRQIEENNARREEERNRKILAEKADMARSRRLAEQEQEALMKKKEDEKERNERVKRENEANKLVKEEMKRKQWEYEAKLNKDYEAKLAREEAAREAAFQKRVDELKKFESNFAGVAAAAAKATEVEYEKTMNAMERKYEEDARKLREKEARRKEEMKKSRDFNLTLIDRKRQIKEEERITDLNRRKQQQKELEEEKRKQEEKKTQQRMQMALMKQSLDAQVTLRHKSESNDKAGLSEKEMDLNRALIAKIKGDPALYKKVMQKVAPPPKGGLGDFKYG